MAVRPAPQARVVVEQPTVLPCSVFDAIASLAFQGIPPPVDATPEDVRATLAVNAKLAQLAEQVRSFTTKEGCR